MNRTTDPLSSILKATLDAAERSASLALQGTESLIMCQMGVTRELISIAGRQFMQWSSEGLPSTAGADWPKLFQANIERMVALTRACAEAATRTQGELARLGREQMDLLGKTWQESMQGITTAAKAAGIAGVEQLEHKHKKAA
jgi:phasin protein